MIESGFNVTFTIRLFMHVKEVGSIFRKKGESVRICGEHGAYVNISEENRADNDHFGWTL